MRRDTPISWPLFLAAALLALLPLAGCSDDDPTGPEPTSRAPELPDPELLTFDFSFFAQAEGLETAKAAGEYDNFVNAYLRAVLLDAMAHIVLAPPVSAFALALHTIPSRQDDGSWIWVYTWVNGDEEAQIRLRGLARDASVDWEMRVTALHEDPPLDRTLWFTGTTSDEGDAGAWTFYDVEDPEHPVSGEIAWGDEADGRFLRFTSHEPGEDGDTLTFHDDDPAYAIVYRDLSASNEWFIRWNEDRHGSLLVPDYNGGEEACWDPDLRNVECD
jgi:hypothetical protein